MNEIEFSLTDNDPLNLDLETTTEKPAPINYNDALNKPRINDVTLQGNKTSSDLGLQPAGDYVDDENYVHTDNNYTNAEKTKLSGIETGAEVNKIDKIKVNGTEQTISSKAVDISVPTNNNQLTNGAGYITSSSLPTKVSDLSNDSGFITNAVNNLTYYTLKTKC